MSVFNRGADGFEHTEANRREVLLAAGGVAAATAVAARSGGHVADKKRPLTATSSVVIDDPDFTAFAITSWSWGASNSGTTHVGGGAGAGKPSFQDVSVEKFVDANSPRLFTALARGENFRKVTLTWVGPKGTPTITLLLEKVILTSLQTGGNTGESRLTEHLTFNFAKVTYSFNDVDGTFDIARGV